ncbi:MAG: hypothetical protein P4L98_09315 [Ancalomicrobiaceae bacterium]|nr:hypothetical protein [Ancalomicrobiaceae bacterium]
MLPDVSVATLRSQWPAASDGVVSGMVAAWPAVAAHYGLATKLRAAHFWGQISWECGGGTELRESGHYTAAGIMRVFGVGSSSSARVSRDEAERLAEQAKSDKGRALFNRVYGLGNPKKAAELGNSEPDDGWLYRGAGALNSTGRAAFLRIGRAIGRDLVGDPDLADDPEIALWMGAEEYVELGCLAHADADDTRAETLRINGGLNGLAGRIRLIEAWKRLLA